MAWIFLYVATVSIGATGKAKNALAMSTLAKGRRAVWDAWKRGRYARLNDQKYKYVYRSQAARRLLW